MTKRMSGVSLPEGRHRLDPARPVRHGLVMLGITMCWLVLAASVASGQIADQIVLFGKNAAGFEGIGRFDRKLTSLGFTQTEASAAGKGYLSQWSGASLDAQGRYWVPFDQLNDTKVLRMAADGSLILPSVNLQYNPARCAVSQSGTVYVLTRIPLSSAGPLYALAADGSVLWSNFAGPSLFDFYPQEMVISPSGHIYMGDRKTIDPLSPVGLLVEVSATTGDILGQGTFSKPAGSSQFGATVSTLAMSPYGTLWFAIGSYLTEIDPTTYQILLQTDMNGAGFNGQTRQFRTDALGNVWTVSAYTPAGDWGGDVLCFSGSTAQLASTYKLAAGAIYGLALGPSGEDLFAVGVQQVPPFPRRLVRLNLVTGVKSTQPLASFDSYGSEWAIPNDDPTGFIWANVTDQGGDADGDGATNREEALAGSNPFDAASRPEGPKVYVSFLPTTNALALTWVDPDGLLDPQGGLDLSTLSVTIGSYGNVFWLLAPFATALDLSPDGKQATLTYGALPLPLDKKWQVEATVVDLTGATASDWQVTPPGDL
ncbi:MAG TPA: hypothetical protein VFY71_13680 [Planctomycetota bacterium]|nr:hypothetical protein [Planctomycetota bacterium]